MISRTIRSGGDCRMNSRPARPSCMTSTRKPSNSSSSWTAMLIPGSSSMTRIVFLESALIRKHQPKTAAFAGLARDVDEAVVSIHDLADQGQADAGALHGQRARVWRAIKFFEDFLAVTCR